MQAALLSRPDLSLKRDRLLGWSSYLHPEICLKSGNVRVLYLAGKLGVQLIQQLLLLEHLVELILLLL